MAPGENGSRSGRDGTEREPHGRPAGCGRGCTGRDADVSDCAARGTVTPGACRIPIATPIPIRPIPLQPISYSIILMRFEYLTLLD